MNKRDTAEGEVDNLRGRYEAMSDVALYDVYFERSTQLGAQLVTLYRMAEALGELDAAEV